jgi:hypothetical protein
MDELRELDVQVAEALGWKSRTVSEYPFGDGTFVVYDGPNGECMYPDGSYFSDIGATQRIEDWIADQPGALWARYVQALCSVHLQDNTPERGDTDEALWWMLIRSTPAQRCRAFLAAVSTP